MSVIAKRPRPAVPTILVTNDDGPPSAESPFLHSFVDALRTTWASDVRVVVPNAQRSWIGKAYLIQERLRGSYYYTPTAAGDGAGGETRRERREKAAGEEEWILLDGTPASCCNIATQCLYPGQIDLVISGPNLGRNTSSAFALSSGTIGAALDGSLTGIPAIALSYGIYSRPIRDEWVAQAHRIAIKTMKTLWEVGFAQDGDADLYSVNIPMVPTILKDPVVVWATQAITRYGRLFLPVPPSDPVNPSASPDSADHARPGSGEVAVAECVPQVSTDVGSAPAASTALHFAFSPDISALIDPKAATHAEGTDADGLDRGWCTVSALKAAFRPAALPQAVNGEWEGKVWKL